MSAVPHGEIVTLAVAVPKPTFEGKILSGVLKSDHYQMEFGWEKLRAVIDSGLVVQVVLLPFAKMREVKEILSAAV